MMHPMDDKSDKSADKGASNKKFQKKVTGGRLKTGSTNRDVYFHVNLNDLDAYTTQVLEAERANKRRWFRRLVGVTLLILGFVFAFTDASDHLGFLMKFASGNVLAEYDEELTTCERQLNGNMSFTQMVDMIIEKPKDQQECRPEVPAEMCVWQNPTRPKARDTSEGWTDEFLHNKEIIDIIEGTGKTLDVVLVGDSLVEHMEGKELGKEQGDLVRDEEVFQQLFSKNHGKIDGLALGIGGDRCANLLYRLENGELKPSFAPKVWWVVVGTTDWESGSSPQAIVAGIIEIVNAIRRVHPNTQIVINSLLPREIDDQSIRQVNQLLACYVNSVRDRQEQELKQELTMVDKDAKIEINETIVKSLEQNTFAKLHFFNATDVFFVKKPTTGEYEVDPGLMLPGDDADEVDNPNAHGEFLWGAKIVDTVLRLTSGHDGEDQNRRRLGAGLKWERLSNRV